VGRIQIPEVLYHLFEYFEKFEMHKKEEGIFRQACGNARTMKLLFFLMFK